MELTALVKWLQEKTDLGGLKYDILAEISSDLEEVIIPPQFTLIEENTSPDRLYILKSGHVETNSKTSYKFGFLAGATINLKALILNEPVNYTVTTLDESKFLSLDRSKFKQLIEKYPEIYQALSQQLAEQVKNLSSQLIQQQELTTILRPYLVNKAKRGVIGKSSYATRLRSQIKEAARNRDSVLIFGEPGLNKDNIAALIHFGSSYRREAVIQVDCSKVQISGAELFGRFGGKPGLIEALGKGTLILSNIQELPEELIPAIARLLKTNKYNPASRRDGYCLVEEKTSLARIIIISEQANTQIQDAIAKTIKVPPVRVRKADLEEILNYYLTLISRSKGINKPSVTTEAIRKLQAYDFPNNLRELESLARRALVQSQDGDLITEEIIWPSQNKKKQFRFNLLNAYPNLRKFLRSPWWPQRINYGFTLVFFAFIVAILFLGPQTRDSNFALNFFWAWWWPLILIVFPLLGRIWCSICPFMIYGEVTQKITQFLFRDRQLKKWPRQWADRWGGWFLFILFALILLWEEIWNLENTAYLSACLLLLITAGAVICSNIFERRFWCRYLCPIGGMNGMFAKLSMIELRAQQGTCSAECCTYQCYKGGPQKGEGMTTDGCPLYSHPAQLDDNKDCVLCMSCLKACPHRSVAFNWRPPGIELWTTHKPRSSEVALLFLLLNVVFLHRLPEIEARLGLNLDLTQFWTHAIVSVIVLSSPALLALLAYGCIYLLNRFAANLKKTKVSKNINFINLAYGYLPLVLAANLAHYLDLGLNEAGQIIPVTLATFNLSYSGLPIIVADPAVITFLQGVTLIFGAILAILLTRKIARQPFKLLFPQDLAILIFTFAIWSIVVGV